MTAAVEIDHLTVQFGHFTAVKDVSLTIKQGEFFILILCIESDKCWHSLVFNLVKIRVLNGRFRHLDC